MTLARANEIQVDGVRVNGACTLGPAGVTFGGSGATVTVEFSEDDAAAFGVPYTAFRAARLDYPTNYPTSKEASARSLLSDAQPVPVRIENGKHIYAITVPLPATAANAAYAAVPTEFVPSEPYPGPESGPNDVYWDDPFVFAPGVNGTVYASIMDASGNLYIGGDFTVAGGVPANRVAKWNPAGGGTWSALGNGMDNTVRAFAVDGSGNLYAGGSFTKAGGVPASYIAKWDGSTWSALGTGMDNTVRALAFDGSGNLYTGGSFTTAGGVSASYIAKWDGTTWSALGTGVNNILSTLACDASGNLYAGGSFTTAGGVAANFVAKWDGTTWSALGTGMNSIVTTLAVDGSGNLCAGGGFTTAGGVVARRVAKWDGTAWSALGAGVNNSVYALAVDGSGNLYAGGGFTTAGGVTVNGIAQWDGTAWSPIASGVTQGSIGALVVDRNTLFAGGSFLQAGGKPSAFFGIWQPRVNESHALMSASPGAMMLGNDVYGFYKPALTTDASTTVTYADGLPVAMTLARAKEIQLGGIRLNGACTLSPVGVAFGGAGATLTVE